MDDCWQVFSSENETLLQRFEEEVRRGPGATFLSDDLLALPDLFRTVCGVLSRFREVGAPLQPWSALDLPSREHPLWGPVLHLTADYGERGGDTHLVLGLMKDLRRAFRAHLLDQARREGAAVLLEMAPTLDAFFDQIEMMLVRQRLYHDFGSSVIEVHEANRALLRQNARWRALFEMLPDPVIMLDEERRLRLLNEAARRLLLQVGQWSTGLLGQPMEEVLPALQGVWQDDEPGLQQDWTEHEIRLPNFRGPRTCKVRSRVLNRPDGAALGRVLVLLDVPEEDLKRRQVERQCRLLREVVEALPEGVLVLDVEGRILFASQRGAEGLQRDAEEILGKNGLRVLSELLGREFLDPFQQVVQGGAESEGQVHVPAWDVWRTWRMVAVPDGVVFSWRDITGEVKRREAQQQSEDRHFLAVESAGLAILDYWVDRGTTYLSPRLHEMFDLHPDWKGDPVQEWRLWVHPEDRQRVEQSLEKAWKGLETRWSADFRYRKRSGEWLWVEARAMLLRSPEGDVTRVVGTLSDATDRHEVLEQMERMALNDSLTGLPNRVLFLDRLNQSLTVARRRPWYHFAVLFLDLDRFKDINDSLGHSAGDEFLKGIAKRIAECLRPGDTVARLGGDEFAVLLNDLVDPSDALDVAERIRQHLSQPLLIRTQEFLPNASIGLAHSNTEYQKAEDVLRDADTAMYRAKEGGRDRIVVFSREMHQEISRRVQLETELRHAVEERQFTIFLQPIVDMVRGRLVGAEALVRWAHPETGIRSPGEFICIAEETGLILPIGEFVLREACGLIARWKERHPEAMELTVSVNFSARQFTHGKPVAMIREVLRETGLPPRCLKVEITESLLMEDVGEILHALQEIDRLGVQLQLDDFGTGYSSLSYLHRFPIRTVKVDRSFVSKLDQVASRELVRAIVTLAGSLHMETIAEGVETRQHLELLRELGCRYAQGFLFSRPVAPEAFEELILRRHSWMPDSSHFEG